MAYKYYDVKTDYNSGRLEKPLTAKHRLFANVGYETHQEEGQLGRWKFDATFNWLSNQRYASTTSNPVQYQLPERTPTFATLKRSNNQSVFSKI